jgi:ribosomal RNA assembly protein
MQHIRIPRERVGVLIGKDGEVKKAIESYSGCTLNIDSETGLVEIEEGGDPLGMLKCMDVVKAIGRGFNPQVAMKLFESDFIMLDIIDLSGSFTTKDALRRIKGRIIGKDGKIRRAMEDLIGAYVSIYGKTVSIIGSPPQIKIIRHAVEMLMDGASHSSVLRYLEKKRRELKEATLDWEVLE